MNKKNEVENFLNILYEFYKKSNYKFFVEKCLSFNVKIGDYNKNISVLSNKVFNNVLNSLSGIECKKEYKETRFYYHLCVNLIENNKFKNNIIVDVPVFEDNYEKIALNITNYLVEHKFNFSLRFYKLLKNSYFKVIFEDIGHCKAFCDYFNMNSEINSLVLSRCIPFLNNHNLLAIYTEIEPFSFKNFYIKYLYQYYGECLKRNVECISLDDFYKYINNKYKAERNLNRKRMFRIMVTYLDIIIRDCSIFDLFITNTVMNISSYSPNEYNLKLDNNKMIYFISKVDGIEIKYGSIDFLNISYSKYYDIVMKKEQNDKYYNDFYNIYSNILSCDYKNINKILTLINDKMDIINKLLIIFSSAFFAYEKLGFSDRVIFSILDQIIPSIYTYKEGEFKELVSSSEYLLMDDYANKIVNLLDGTKMSFREYINKNNILDNIKNDYVLHMKSGEVISGKQFLDNLYKYISSYNTFKELFDDMVYMMEYK